MSKLNKDVISLIVKELYDKNNTLYSCLLVNRSWYETTVPILWKDLYRFLLKDKALNIIINVILSYLSEESSDTNLRNQDIVLINTYQQPLFYYISYWKYLNLDVLERMIEGFVIDKTNIDHSKIPIIESEIINIFNRNTKFFFGYRTLYGSFCSNSIRSNDILAEELDILNTSIKSLSFDILCDGDNPDIIKLIESQKNLKKFKLYLPINNETIVRPIEESLIKCADTIQYLRINWRPDTKLFSYLENLLSLEIIQTQKLELFGKDIFTSFKISKSSTRPI
ncbi:hypothetical protein RhiirA1_474446 [Rhizophagus irregularis]|uniref:F-box domain-containing protein n=1 Tax=Rhizophagus irregularis TaxID=588596 RepID=A0A2N0QYK0_9GLOM|nr:hypothetical protein RhiirA1_474446 [Rhizophagus irregularis]